ncbi:MAG: CPBP family intramembrane glutamic endopeptidase [Planctomycetota bacterium]
MTTTGHDAGRRRAMGLFGLLLLVPAPTIGVIASMYLWPQSALGSGIYSAAKVWILALPVLWWWRFERGRRGRRPVEPPAFRVWPTATSMLVGVASGLLIAASIGLTYWLVGRHWIDPAAMRERLTGIGLGDPTRFVVFAAFVCTVNSLLEEYVWRWFVVRRGEEAAGRVAAVFISAACFTLHHVVAMAVYFDARTVALASTGVFLGGLIWSVLFARYRNVWPGWISHVIADVAIMVVGWQIVFG